MNQTLATTPQAPHPLALRPYVGVGSAVLYGTVAVAMNFVGALGWGVDGSGWGVGGV